MSLRTEEEPSLEDYFAAMERANEKAKCPIKLIRIDLQEGDYEISKTIVESITKADILICDFTLRSHNVYFEAGVARGVGCYVIQLARKGTELEFDVRNWRTLHYRNATELEVILIPALREAYGVVSTKNSRPRR
jgi:hypothetical protein